MKPGISGVLILRNGVKLDYPFGLAIRSLLPFCDEVIIAIDRTGDDGTWEAVEKDFGDVVRMVDTPWDMANHQGHGNSEIARQTGVACALATHQWVISLQADEVLHEKDAERLRATLKNADNPGHRQTAFMLKRLYFYGSIDVIRTDWTQSMVRIFRNGMWRPDPHSGGMTFLPVPAGDGVGELHEFTDDLNAMHLQDIRLYHYSRIGDPASIAQRVRNLDGFYHASEKLESRNEIADYDFIPVELDTYRRDADSGGWAGEVLAPWSGTHPAGVREHFKAHPRSLGVRFWGRQPPQPPSGMSFLDELAHAWIKMPDSGQGDWSIRGCALTGGRSGYPTNQITRIRPEDEGVIYCSNCVRSSDVNWPKSPR